MQGYESSPFSHTSYNEIAQHNRYTQYSISALTSDRVYFGKDNYIKAFKLHLHVPQDQRELLKSILRYNLVPQTHLIPAFSI